MAVTDEQGPIQVRDAASRTWVVVPACNEAAVIGGVVAGLARVFPNIVVVDDGSSDPTRAAALAAGAIVVTHPFNLGQGAALQTGFEYALARGALYVATFDADGQHRVEDLRRMLEVLVDEPLDVVLGSRFLGESLGMGAARSLALRAAARFTGLTTGVKLTDAHNGLRMMTAAAAKKIRIRQNRMAHASEIIAEIGRHGLRVREIPVTITYSSYSVAKGQKLTNGFRILADLFVGWLLR